MKQLIRRRLTYLLISEAVLAAATLSYAQGSIVHQINLPAGDSWCDDSMINGLFTQINQIRAQNGVAALKMDTVGMKDAELRATQFAAYMAVNSTSTPGFNPHQGYDTTAASLGYNIYSEDLAYMNSSPSYIVYSIWQDSLHLSAMLASQATVAGVSCIYSSSIPYWTYEPGYSGTSTSPTPPSNPAPPPAGTPTMDSEEISFLSLINNYRAQNGAGPLKVSIALENSSSWMATDMATKNYMDHTDSLGRSAGTRLAAFGYTYSPWGENIAAGFTDAQSVLNGWINACDADTSGKCTYAHRQNMLNPSYAVIGIGRAYGSSSMYGWYWTTDFGGIVDATMNPSPGTTTAPTVSSFTASPASITAGQSSTLAWSVAGTGVTVTIDNGVGTVTTTSKAVSPAQTTTYTLTATNSGGSATGKVTVTVTPKSTADVQPPTAPAITSSAAKSSTEVDLGWSTSSDNVAVTGYQIARNGSAIGNVTAATHTYADMALSPGTSYTYTIKAFDAAGNYSSASNSVQVSTLPPAPVSPSCPGPATGAFTGCYYPNTTLSGNPALVRTDNYISFSWGSGSPATALPAKNFSVRWQGNYTFAQGTYKFTVVTSDGMRLYLDGNKVLDGWRDQSPSIYSAQQALSQGTHLITIEYYEKTGGAVANISWQQIAGGSVGQVPVVSSFSASPSSLTAGQSSTLSWNVSGATTLTIDNGIGSVTGATSKAVTPAQTTTYTLTATNSAGSATARTSITVTPKQGSTADTQAPSAPGIVSIMPKSSTEVDLQWTASSDNVGVTGYQILRNGAVLTSVSGSTLNYADISAAGNTTYSYVVKAFDLASNLSGPSNTAQVTTPAAAAPSSCATPGNGVFTGCYYANTTLSGSPVLVRTDNVINFSWGAGSPSNAVPAENFSIRWQGNFNFAQGNYKFTAITSDGMRVFIDGTQVLNQWRDQPPYMYVVPVTLSQGSHLIVVEYYERTGGSTTKLSWLKQ